jgi:hypothetical protein
MPDKFDFSRTKFREDRDRAAPEQMSCEAETMAPISLLIVPGIRHNSRLSQTKDCH